MISSILELKQNVYACQNKCHWISVLKSSRIDYKIRCLSTKRKNNAIGMEAVHFTNINQSFAN